MTRLEQIIKQANDNFEARRNIEQRHTATGGHDLQALGRHLRMQHETATVFVIAREGQRHHL